jgi:hypothetical protein
MEKGVIMGKEEDPFQKSFFGQSLSILPLKEKITTLKKVSDQLAMDCQP